MTRESRAKSSEAELHKATITQKEAEIQQLLHKLEEQQAHQSQDSSQLKQEKEREVAAAVEELQAHLLEAQRAKGNAEEELAAAQFHTDTLRKRQEKFKELELATQKKV